VQSSSAVGGPAVTAQAVSVRLRIFEALYGGNPHATYSAAEIADMLDPRPSEKSVGMALKVLGFVEAEPPKSVREAHHFCNHLKGSETVTRSSLNRRGMSRRKSFNRYQRGNHAKAGCGSLVAKVSRRWSPPVDWPPLVATEQRLVKLGASYSMVDRASNQAARVERILRWAIEDANGANGGVRARGELMRAIRREIEALEHRSIRADDLADSLRENPDMPKAAMLNLVEGYIRAATRKERKANR